LAEGREATARLPHGKAGYDPNSLALEVRVGRLEVLIKALQEELEIRQRHEIVLQGQLDHLLARLKAKGV
jgi:hypothetical protein